MKQTKTEIWAKWR